MSPRRHRYFILKHSVFGFSSALVNLYFLSLFSTKPEGYVGFGSLPDQVYRKAVRKGFEFNLMVVGESGLGKVII